MQLTHAALVLLAVSIFAGALHVLSPDHWMPASVMAWQRGWRMRRVTGVAVLAFAAHAILGFAIFFALSRLISTPAQALAVFLCVAGLLAVRRTRRFSSRAHSLFGSSTDGFWNFLAVASVLGPAEALLPIFFRARALGMGYLLPFAAFLLGTLGAGILFIGLGKRWWNRPFWLPRAMSFARRPGSMLPVAFGLSLAIAFFAFRLS